MKNKVSNVNDIVVQGVTSIVRKGSSWTGTMTALTTALTKKLGKKQSVSLPGSPAALRVVVNRVIRRLRSNGIAVQFGRTTDHNRTRFVKFAR